MTLGVGDQNGQPSGIYVIVAGVCIAFQVRTFSVKLSRGVCKLSKIKDCNVVDSSRASQPALCLVQRFQNLVET